MNNWLIAQEKSFLLVVCTLAIGLYLVNLLYMLMSMQGANAADLWYEIGAFIMQLPILAPAVIGLWKINQLQLNKMTFLAYIIYLFIVIYIYSAPFWATDPLQPGLMFVVIGLPFSILFGISLLGKKHNSQVS